MEIGGNLNFDVFSLLKKAGRTPAVLARLAKFISFTQKPILTKTFVEPRLHYCPLIWMFHRSKASSKINHLQ